MRTSVGLSSRSSMDFTDRLGDPNGSLRSMAPRRRRPAARPTGMISIFEDQTSASATNNEVQPRHQARSDDTSTTQGEFTRSIMTGKASLRRPSISRPTPTAGNHRPQEMATDKTVLKKEPRRRTIWVPSDDTTVMSIHPGNRDDQTTTTNIFPSEKTSDDTTANLELHKERPKRAGRRSSLAQAPRRVGPLQPTLRPLQENVETVTEQEGANTGKENVPPGYMATVELEPGKKGKVTASQIIAKRRASMLPPLGITSTDTANAIAKKRGLNSPEERPTDRRPRASLAGHAVAPRRLSTIHAPAESKRSPKAMVEEVPRVKIYKPRMSTVHASNSAVQKYPLITENIQQPQMFEESWLSNQETAITELINRVFSSSMSNGPGSQIGTLRSQFMDVYQGRSMLLLFQRIQASLQFGALSLPKERETGQDAARFVNDIGLRQRFMHLWTKTYSDQVLRAAVEVVVGRQVSTNEDRPLLTSDLEGFLSTCLLRNEDATTAPAAANGISKSVAWNWRRTMQRGLMLIQLLDQVKELELVRGNLFKTTSLHKSSASVLTEFVSIMLPWGGEMVRALGHIDYNLAHVQYALSEFDYTITNLAIDLRDGIRLTRLVELLLYPNSERRLSDDQTISMPTGEVLSTSKPTNAFGPLSQHLKYPCTSHASKAYNNQIALSALLSVRNIAEVAAKTTTNDIVQGHRENTLALLWALVGQWGLNSLIDWNDVRGEIIRIAPGTVHETLLNKDLSSPSQRTQHRLLRDWASSIAAKHNLPVSNLTTSFSNGTIFSLIVDEYTPYLAPSAHKPNGLESKPSGLEAQLTALGCSTAFASIFGAPGKFFDEEFTRATLAFLCSRLLPPSRGIREKRAVLKRVAEDCAMVVRTRERVLGAAVCIQRAWRRHWEWRVGRLERGEVDVWLV